jgi:hypothetical protein
MNKEIKKNQDSPEIKMTKEILKKEIAKKKERDSEMVTGIFKNLEAPGGSVRFVFDIYGEGLKNYELFDGERYTIPRGVARHLNNGCFYKEYRHLKGEFGDQGIRAGYNDGSLKAENMYSTRKVHRFSFQSLEFMDDDVELAPPPDIAEVKTV